MKPMKCPTVETCIPGVFFDKMSIERDELGVAYISYRTTCGCIASNRVYPEGHRDFPCGGANYTDQRLGTHSRQPYSIPVAFEAFAAESMVYEKKLNETIVAGLRNRVNPTQTQTRK